MTQENIHKNSSENIDTISEKELLKNICHQNKQIIKFLEKISDSLSVGLDTLKEIRRNTLTKADKWADQFSSRAGDGGRG